MELSGNVLFVFHSDAVIVNQHRIFHELLDKSMLQDQELTEIEETDYLAAEAYLDKNLRLFANSGNGVFYEFDYDEVYHKQLDLSLDYSFYENNSTTSALFFQTIKEHVANKQMDSGILGLFDEQACRLFEYVTVWNEY